jgi:hypothetical protein
VNLVEQINKAFRQGLSKAKLGKLNFSGTHSNRTAASTAGTSTSTAASGSSAFGTSTSGRTSGKTSGVTSGVNASPLQFIPGSADDDRLTYTDTLRMISAGLLANPDTARYRLTLPTK